MVSEKAFATEVADVRQAEVAPEYVGEEGEAVADGGQEIPGVEAEASEVAVDDDNVDLAAVLGGNIRKAPVAATEDEAEPEPAHAATGA